MEYKDKVAVVTGGAHGIGQCITEEFRKRGASVAVIDVRKGDHFVGDISRKEVLEAFAEEVIGKYGKVNYIINNAKDNETISKREEGTEGDTPYLCNSVVSVYQPWKRKGHPDSEHKL